MKKLILPFAAIAVLASCGTPNTSSENETPATDSVAVAPAETPKVCKKGYDNAATTIEFGGFKTTDKKEVKGFFKDFTITNTKVADTHEEIFAEAVFSVPVNYLETNDIGRNRRIRDEYFGSMENSKELTGKVIGFQKDSSKVQVELTINAVTKNIDLDYKISGDTIALTGTIDILDFNGDQALAALNKACEALHKGPDGVSKTWSDVNLYITSVVKEACE